MADPSITELPQKDAEWQRRCELAAAHRLFAHFGWTDAIFTHLSVRVPGKTDQYFVTPYGLLFDEVTGSSVLKVDFDGNVIEGEGPCSEPGHEIHTAVLKARKDVGSVLHSHTRAGIAVSCMQDGLLPLSQQSGELRDLVNYHDYLVVGSDRPEACRKLGEDLGDKPLLILRNHGLLSTGRTIAEAFFYLYTLENACKVQVDVMRSGATPSAPTLEQQELLAHSTLPPADGVADYVTLTWDALIRMLQRKGSDHAS